MASDRIAIAKRGADHIARFYIDGRWWDVPFHGGAIRPITEQEVRQSLRAASTLYAWNYGESLGWDIDAIPVIEA